MTPQITVNMGLRYDISLAYLERFNRRTSTFDPYAVHPYNDRIRAAWASQKTAYDATNPRYPYPDVPRKSPGAGSLPAWAIRPAARWIPTTRRSRRASASRGDRAENRAAHRRRRLLRESQSRPEQCRIQPVDRLCGLARRRAVSVGLRESRFLHQRSADRSLFAGQSVPERLRGSAGRKRRSRWPASATA